VPFYLGHFWSLCVEEQSYLVWPWLVFWIRDRSKLAWVCAATLLLCPAMRLAGQHFLPQWLPRKGIKGKRGAEPVTEKSGEKAALGPDPTRTLLPQSWPTAPTRKLANE
jgi:hypothetical protein